jgi:PHD/YefM family antitoxin component YafN of YafNO toxin-antitoxin module
MRDTVTASAFARNFGKYRVEAQRAPIPISNHGEVTGYFVAKADFETMKELIRRSREHLLDQKSMAAGELSGDIVDAISGSEMDGRFEDLNALLDD